MVRLLASLFFSAEENCKPFSGKLGIVCRWWDGADKGILFTLDVQDCFAIMLEESSYDLIGVNGQWQLNCVTCGKSWPFSCFAPLPAEKNAQSNASKTR